MTIIFEKCVPGWLISALTRLCGGGQTPAVEGLKYWLFADNSLLDRKTVASDKLPLKVNSNFGETFLKNKRLTLANGKQII